MEKETIKKVPRSLMRQVQFITGGFILLGSLLTHYNPNFIWVPIIIGAGLFTAGITGFCGLSKVLERMPWNK